jgi:hypothetical protein
LGRLKLKVPSRPNQQASGILHTSFGLGEMTLQRGKELVHVASRKAGLKVAHALTDHVNATIAIRTIEKMEQLKQHGTIPEGECFFLPKRTDFEQQQTRQDNKDKNQTRIPPDHNTMKQPDIHLSRN